MTTHKAGFVNIIGKPNVGKSTLLNELMGEKIAITTFKAQTTRHRIMGIYSDDDIQIVFSDTPGAIEPKYELHKAMMSYVNEALDDADVILFMVDVAEQDVSEVLVEKLQRTDLPVLIVLNKIDLVDQDELEKVVLKYTELFPTMEIFPISALNHFNVDHLLAKITSLIPEHPAFFEKDQITDKTERFIAAETIREKIFLYYKEEIPYSCDVQISLFQHQEDKIHIRAEIYVERDSQKGIVIGKRGVALKRVGTSARKDLERFFKKKIFLEQYVKVEKDWRKKRSTLKQMGYN